MLDVLRHDVSAAAAALAASRWSSVSAVVTLAVGVGACLTGTLLAYGGLLHPLPVPREHELVAVTQVYRPTGVRDGVRLTQFADWRDRLGGIAALAGAARERATVRVPGAEPIDANVAYVTDEWFRVVGLTAATGRVLDERAEPSAAVVSAAFAARVSGAFTMGGRPFEVVGVLPPSAAAIEDRDVWALARAASPLTISGGADTRSYQMVARLAANHTVDQARAVAAAVAKDLAPETQRWARDVEVRSWRDEVVGDRRGVLLTLALTAALILAVTCANVGMGLVNRALARQRELSVRLALGAERRGLVRGVIVEVALLVLAGGAAGAWLARLATTWLQDAPSAGLPAASTQLSTVVFALGAGGVGAVVVLACAVAPVVAILRMNLAATLRPREAIGSRTGARLRAVLVAAQLATAVVLGSGATLLGRTLVALSHADIGLDGPDAVATVSVPIGESLAAPADRAATARRLVEGARTLPGVTAAGLGGALPPSTTGIVFTIRVSSDTADATRAFDLVPVTPGYLDAIGVRLISGRLLAPADEGGPPVAVMSESAVRHLALAIDTALDHELNLPLPSAAGPRVKPRIVGIVRDLRYSGLDASARGAIFVPWPQLPLGRAHLAVRTTGDPAAVLPALARLVRDADPTMPPGRARTLAAAIDESLAARTARFGAAVATAFVGALLAAIALISAMVRSVVERRRELAVRAAVGASPSELLRATLWRGLRLAGAGVAVGVAAAAGFARVTSSMLWGVSPDDPTTYLATAAGAMTLAVAACYPPARHAAAAEPAVLLSSE